MTRESRPENGGDMTESVTSDQAGNPNPNRRIVRATPEETWGVFRDRHRLDGAGSLPPEALAELLSLLNSPRGPCGGLSPLEYVGLSTIAADLHDGVPLGVNLGSWKTRDADLDAHIPRLLELIRFERPLYEAVGFGARAATPDKRVMLHGTARNGNRWALMEQPDGSFAWFRLDESGTPVEMHGVPGRVPPEFAILLRVHAWWKTYSHPDSLARHKHFECCVYPALTEVLGYPTSQEIRTVVARAAALAGHPVEGERLSDLTREVCAELIANPRKDLLWRRKDGRLADNVRAIRDLLKQRKFRSPGVVSLDKPVSGSGEGAVTLEASLASGGSTGPAEAVMAAETTRLVRGLLEEGRRLGYAVDAAAEYLANREETTRAGVAAAHHTTEKKLRTAEDWLKPRLARILSE